MEKYGGKMKEYQEFPHFFIFVSGSSLDGRTDQSAVGLTHLVLRKNKENLLEVTVRRSRVRPMSMQLSGKEKLLDENDKNQTAQQTKPNLIVLARK